MSGRGFGTHFYQFVHQNLKINKEVNKNLFSVPEFVGEKIIISGAIFWVEKCLRSDWTWIPRNLQNLISHEADYGEGQEDVRLLYEQTELSASPQDKSRSCRKRDDVWWPTQTLTLPYGRRECGDVDLTRIKKLESASFLCNYVWNILPGL